MSTGYKDRTRGMKRIKEMPEFSRPREKLREKGVQVLTDEEFVAAIIGMGMAGVHVRTIARPGSIHRPRLRRRGQD